MNKIEIKTPLGEMIAIADDEHLLLLEFFDRKHIDKNLKQFEDVVEKENKTLKQIKQELNNYFSGKSLTFKTPIKLNGTEFQNKVWHALTTIPAGDTWSYAKLAQSIKQDTAFRAVANANSKNQLSLIAPCHRVINSDGKLGGYASGLERKAWLLEHEQKYVSLSQN